MKNWSGNEATQDQAAKKRPGLEATPVLASAEGSFRWR